MIMITSTIMMTMIMSNKGAGVLAKLV
jgi:hypothetical protein